MSSGGINVCKFLRDFPREREISYGRGPTFYYLSREQAKLGVNVHIISIRKGERDYQLIDGINVHRVSLPYAFYSLREYMQLNRRFRIDIVHTHATSGMPYALLKRIVGPKPHVVHLHHLMRGAKGVPFSYSPIDHLGSEIRLYTSVVRRKLTWKRADAIIAVSKAVANDLIRIYDIAPEKIQVVYNGVAPEIFMPRKDTIDLARKLDLNGKSVILYVGDFGLRKGLKYLIEAVPYVVKEIPETMFLLIGGTPEWLGTQIYWQMLHEQISRLQIQKYVKLMGSVPHLELPKYYSLAKIFVLPSLYEGLGKVLLEAMACAKPVIATNVGGIPEIVTDNEDGVLVPPCRPDRIADAIIEFLRDPKKARRMGTNGRDKVRKNFTWKHAAEKTNNVYRQLIS